MERGRWWWWWQGKENGLGTEFAAGCRAAVAVAVPSAPLLLGRTADASACSAVKAWGEGCESRGLGKVRYAGAYAEAVVGSVYCLGGAAQRLRSEVYST